MLGGNCAIVGNKAFPSCFSSSPSGTVASVPFSTIHVKRNGDIALGTHGLCYYEVSIGDAIVPSSLNSSSRAQMEANNADKEPCIAVGMACSMFPLLNRMPGWDVFSFAYHSDDGNFFHEDSENSKVK